MKRQRIVSVELLRIISMLFIVSGHFIGQGKILDVFIENDVERLFFVFMGSAHRISVNIFLIIGVWFMVDSNFHGRRLVRMHSQVLFYTLPITGILFLLGYNVGVGKLVQSCMPILGRPLWFASAYMLLFLLSPYLKKVFRLPKEQLIMLVFLLLMISCILPMLAEEMDTFLDNFLWFVVVYIGIGYIKKYANNLNHKRWLFLGIVIYFILCSCKIIGLYYSTESSFGVYLVRFSERMLHDIKSIPNVMCALCTFLGVKSINLKYNKVIDFLSAGSFSVYIIHQIPVFWNILWQKMLLSWNMINSEHYPFWFVAELFTLYILISSIDVARRFLFERYWMKSRVAIKIGTVLDNMLGVRISI